MKRRSAVILTIAIFTAVIALIWLQSHRDSLNIRGSQAHATPMRAEISATPSEVAGPVQEERNQTQEERKRAVVQAIERTNVPIKFWGKVVDPDQKPIDGVNVLFSYSTERGNAVGAAWGEQQIHKGEVRTDASGLFVIDGIAGHMLTIDDFQKDGYRHATKGVKTYNYYGDTSSGKFVANADKPVVFVMTNDAMAEGLVVYGGTFGKTIRVAGNGTPMRWDVWKGQADPNGELQITLLRTPPLVERVGQVSAWSAKVAVIGGGIIEALPGEQFYRAPESGYAPELDYPKSQQQRGISARSFYIRTADGKYGRFELNLYADDEGPTARCLIKACLNPSGSRNLEPPPAP